MDQQTGMYAIPWGARRWLNRLTKLGWFLVVVGVAGEGVAEYMGSEAEGALRVFNGILVSGLEQQSADVLLEQGRLTKENLLLQTDLLRLRRESEPRRLTGTQRGMLTRLLNGTHSAVVIVSKLVDPESSDFADDFNTLLHDSLHWDTLRVVNRITRRYGVSLGTVTGTVFSPEARRLDEALTTIGILHDNPTFPNGDASTDPAFQPRTLYLVIEQKPLPTPRR